MVSHSLMNSTLFFWKYSTRAVFVVLQRQSNLHCRPAHPVQVTKAAEVGAEDNPVQPVPGPQAAETGVEESLITAPYVKSHCEATQLVAKNSLINLFFIKVLVTKFKTNVHQKSYSA